jgi:hypothetical protein
VSLCVVGLRLVGLVVADRGGRFLPLQPVVLVPLPVLLAPMLGETSVLLLLGGPERRIAARRLALPCNHTSPMCPEITLL